MYVSSAYITDVVTEIHLLYKLIIGSEGVWKKKLQHELINLTMILTLATVAIAIFTISKPQQVPSHLSFLDHSSIIHHQK